ncbi:MAG: 50S ribosomal protein L6 [Chloroflexota bacterium]|nr:50S ribosomal protein L6 [Chloroflexota bacterium]PLS80047.1 MAG: 50S ribosomal protein L6 [Chloroflexota bacterium]
MSRIGKKPITVPNGVTVTVGEGNLVTVKGPKGSLTQQLPADITISQQDGTLNVARPSDEKQHRALHGLTRALLNNMVMGTSTGFQKVLEINGVGYRAQKTGKNLTMSLGFSHPVIVEAPDGITLDVGERNTVVISGADKQVVGEVAANIRSLRPPEPYKGKGIKYSTETIRRKAGKAGKTGKGGKK